MSEETKPLFYRTVKMDDRRFVRRITFRYMHAQDHISLQDWLWLPRWIVHWRFIYKREVHLWFEKARMKRVRPYNKLCPLFSKEFSLVIEGLSVDVGLDDRGWVITVSGVYTDGSVIKTERRELPKAILSLIKSVKRKDEIAVGFYGEPKE